MKKIIIFIFMFGVSHPGISQVFLNSPTVGGNNNRSGYNENFLDGGLPYNRTFNAPSSLWGMPLFTYGNKFVTTRYTSLSPLRALISAFSFGFGSNSIWLYGESSGVNVIMGFDNDKVYARDFQQNGYDTIFALNSTTGSLIWKSRFTVERGIIWTAVFTSNGDLIVPGSDNKRIMRINNLNGDTVWTNSRIIPNTGAECMCINGNTLYAWQGSITTPKTIIAIDAGTGITKYSSPALPGDGDQEIPFTVSRNGVVYCIRDGGMLYAIKDNGTGLNILWSRDIPQPVGTYTQIAIGKDSTVYAPFGKKIFRINQQTGVDLDSSIDLVNSGTINPRFSISGQGRIYVGNGASDPVQGKYFTFSQDLHTTFQQIPFTYNYYSGPTWGGDIYVPHLLMTGNGTEIKAIVNSFDKIINITSVNPDKFDLYQNYPNPFNPVTKINFSIPMRSHVSLKVYNILGTEIESFVDGYLNSGSYEAEFDGTNLPSGVYFYRLISEDFEKTRKMNLIK